MDADKTQAAEPQEVDPNAELSDLSAEELAAREQSHVKEFDAADQADDLDAMAAAATQIDTVRAELDRRKSDEAKAPEAEPVTASADAAVIDAPVAAEAAEVTPEATEVAPEAAAPAETEAPAAVEVPTEEASPEATAETEADPAEAPTDDVPASGDDDTTTTDASVTADGSAPKEGAVNENIPADRIPEATPEVSPYSTTITAGADVPGYGAGLEFTDRMDTAKAMEARLNSIKRARGGDGEQHSVMTITASVPSDRMLDGDGGPSDVAKIDEVTRAEAITAAGGYCAPLETRYDLFGTGSTARPVRDALAGFQARRGGIRFSAAPKIADFADAMGLWTAANDANPAVDVDGNIVPKPCLEVECAPEVTATIDAVTLCMKFGNLMTRAYPELIDRNNQLALVAHARFAERTLLDKMTALSTSVTSAFKLGAARDFLNAIGKAAAAYRNRYRMERTQMLRVIAPEWVLDMMREDLAYTAPGDDQLAVADSIIASYIRARNVNISWHMDGTGFGNEVGGSTLDEFPGSFSWYIYAEGAFLFLDGGTLDLGVVRDSDLVGTNDYKTFTESFEGVARIGAESIKVTTTTKVAGAFAAAVNTVS